MTHVPEQCPVCGPFISHPSYLLGIAKAKEAQRQADDGE